MRRLRPCLAALTLLVLGVPAAHAQVVRGVVVTGDSTPVGGAVVSLLDSTNAQFGAVLTDEFGGFEVRAPRAGTWRLQTERVGFARVVSFPFPIASGQTVLRRVLLRDATARLGTLQVSDRTRCDVRPAEGTLVATLWDEARKALAAASAASTASPLFSLDRDEIEYDSTHVRAHSASRSTTTGRVAQVFRSAPPASLRGLGYVRVIDTTTVYFGPDARALLSNEFAATHCFALAGDDPTSIRRIGVAFSPVGRPREVVDVAGTLWIDRDTYELDRVDFRFVPSLSDELPDTTFGGRVQFARIPGGQLIVRQWVLRMPIFAPAGERRAAPEGATSRMLVRAAARERITGLKVERGMTRLPEERPAPLPEVVARRGRSGAPACNADSLARVGEGWIVGLTRDERRRAVANAGVRVSWLRADNTGSRVIFREEWIESTADAQGRYAVCGVPKATPLAIAARVRSGSRHRARAVVPDSGALELDLDLAGRDLIVLPTAEGVARGRVMDGTGRPVRNAQLMLLSPARRIATDSAGQFLIDALPPRGHDVFVRRLGFVPLMVSFTALPGDTIVLPIRLDAAAQMLAAVTIEATVSSLNYQGFERRREARSGGGIFIGQDFIDERPAMALVNILRGAGRMVIEESQATGDVRAYGRGGTNVFDTLAVDRCPMRMVLDGVALNDASPLNVLPPPREIAGIEIYTSSITIPPQFAYSNPKCGLIVVWTRDGVRSPLRAPRGTADLPWATAAGCSRSRRRRARRP